MTVWVLIVVLLGSNFTQSVTHVGTYATRDDCRKVAEAADLQPGRFRCVEVQKIP